MKKLYIIAAVIVLYFLLRKPLINWYMKRQSGLQAAQAAASETGYTTYNTQIYKAPAWLPSLSFFKAGAFSGSSASVGSQSSPANQVNYGLQG